MSLCHKIIAGGMLVASTFLLSGCDTNKTEYMFNDYIGKEKIELIKITHRFSETQYKLIVTEPNGRKTTYYDSIFNDFLIEELKIENQDEPKEYKWKNGVYDRKILQKAQQQFDNYIKKIAEYNLKH